MTNPSKECSSVRLSFHRAALAACLVSATCAASALGQGAPASRPANTPTPSAPTGTNVAVIDIALIFKHHDRFNAAMGDIKKDIEQFEALIRDEQKKLKARVDELQAFNPGTTDFQKREAEVARLDSELKVTIGQKRREFLEQEARVYYRVYKEVEQSVGVFAQRFRIGLVLRYNSDDMKEDDRASVLQGVNRAVVWHGNLDITPQIITELNRRPFNPDDVNRSATPGTPGTAGPATTGAAAGGQGRIASPPIIPGQGTKSR
jgi:Skp family chaperone for outer membrane proteins